MWASFNKIGRVVIVVEYSRSTVEFSFPNMTREYIRQLLEQQLRNAKIASIFWELISN